jgi:hypothetical protein
MARCEPGWAAFGKTRFWVAARGIGNGDGAALRHAEESESLQPEEIRHGLQITDPGRERKTRRRPVRKSAAPLIVADIRMLA